MSLENTAATTPATSEVAKEVQEQNGATLDVQKLAKRLDDAQAFIAKQAAEIGELRKMVETKNAELGEKGQKTLTPEPDKPFFETLSPSEQESVKAFMQKKLSELPEQDAVAMREGLSDPVAFNSIAKDVVEKIRRPKYIDEVIGSAASRKQEKNDMEEFTVKARAVFGLIDKAVDKRLPPGGTPGGTTQSAPPAKKQVYPNGGILSLTKK